LPSGYKTLVHEKPQQTITGLLEMLLDGILSPRAFYRAVDQHVVSAVGLSRTVDLMANVIHPTEWAGGPEPPYITTVVHWIRRQKPEHAIRRLIELALACGLGGAVYNAVFDELSALPPHWLELDLLHRLIKTTDPGQLDVLLGCLGIFGHSESAREKLKFVLLPGDTRERMRTLHDLLNSDDRSRSLVAVAMIEHDETDLREVAARSLSRWWVPEAIQALQDAYLREPETSVKEAIVETLYKIQSKKSINAMRFLRNKEKNRWSRRFIQDLLSEIAT
jgi:hypothetical protein